MFAEADIYTTSFTHTTNIHTVSMISPADSSTAELIRPLTPLTPGNVESPHQQIDGTKQKFEDLKQLVKIEIENCPNDTELDVLYKTLQCDPSTIDHQCKLVSNDLHRILLPLGPKQIHLFGSTVMGVSFQGSSN